jgi:hypothetical protein
LSFRAERSEARNLTKKEFSDSLETDLQITLLPCQISHLDNPRSGSAWRKSVEVRNDNFMRLEIQMRSGEQSGGNTPPDSSLRSPACCRQGMTPKGIVTSSTKGDDHDCSKVLASQVFATRSFIHISFRCGRAAGGIAILKTSP